MQRPRTTARAAALHGRRALNERLALALSYRFYADRWSLLSHTAQGSLSFMPGEDSVLALDYRFYAQSAAKYYSARMEGFDPTKNSVVRDGRERGHPERVSRRVSARAGVHITARGSRTQGS
jgi:hypothetical protein